MSTTDTTAFFDRLLSSPVSGANAWLELPQRINVSAGIDAARSVLRLIAPLGCPRRADDTALAADLLAWNGEHLDVAAPCFSLDEHDGVVCLSATLALPGLTSEMAADATERIACAIVDARLRLADAIVFVE